MSEELLITMNGNPNTVQLTWSNNATIFLVEERANPSSAYFLLPFLEKKHFVVRCSWQNTPALADLKNAVVIFVRYIPSAWAKIINKVGSDLAGLVYFMDDDLLDLKATAGMPLRYRYKLARFARLRKKWLQRQGAALWVSSPICFNIFLTS